MIRVMLALALLALAASGRADDQTTALLEAGYPDTALAELEARLGANPYDPVALNNLAVARARGDEVFAALELLDRAARLAPEHPVIAENRNRLRTWLMRRIERADAHGSDDAVAGASRPPALLPEPPPLWVP
ncbi:hypothetical protein [Sinimarinibacterium thermocellulolyticum]|uniref:Tetratricopeptide repeat protein n=1 Tax=Sinimarinibacterium thermocellulolyticum TaxID=3170016 RepID=A0ABV2A994_9GAMM